MEHSLLLPSKKLTLLNFKSCQFTLDQIKDVRILTSKPQSRDEVVGEASDGLEKGEQALVECSQNSGQQDAAVDPLHRRGSPHSSQAVSRPLCWVTYIN